MRNLLQVLIRYSNFLIFIILEVVAFILICTTQHYQRSTVWSSANRFVAGCEQTITDIGDYFRLKQDNQILAEENAQLKKQIQEQANILEQYTEKNAEYTYSHLDWNYIPAKIVGLTTHKQHNYLTINKGLRDSIRVDMGVICHEGVVGIVSAVGEKFSLIVPIIHTEMNLSCKLKNNNYIGRTQWDGIHYKEVQLEDISRHITVCQGDTVVTSGLTPIFPEGIVVGTILSSRITDKDNYHRIILQLATNYKTIKYVQVLRNNNAIYTDDTTSWHGLEK